MQRCCNVFLFPFLYKEEQRHAPSGNSVWCTAHHAAYLRPRAKSPLQVITSTTSPHPSNFEEIAPVVNRTPPTRCPCRASVSPQSFSGLPEPLRLTYTQPATATQRSQGQTKGERESGAGTLGRWAPWPYRCHWAPKGPKNPLPASAAAGQTGSKIGRCKISVSKWT